MRIRMKTYSNGYQETGHLLSTDSCLGLDQVGLTNLGKVSKVRCQMDDHSDNDLTVKLRYYSKEHLI